MDFLHDLIFSIKAFIADNLSGFQIGNIPFFLINLILTALLAYALGVLFIKFGNTHSNRNSFGRNFVLLSVTTMFIITFVKSSLALSLGLVGALSIVRFRSAIKEPEELSYLFLSIALGLGVGAGFSVLTVLGFSVISIIIWLNSLLGKKISSQNLILSISNKTGQTIDTQKIIDILEKHSSSLRLKRIDESGTYFEVSFLVSFKNYKDIQNSKSDLKQIYSDLNITYMDTSNDF